MKILRQLIFFVPRMIWRGVSFIYEDTTGVPVVDRIIRDILTFIMVIVFVFILLFLIH
jgi:hypothetical protein